MMAASHAENVRLPPIFVVDKCNAEPLSVPRATSGLRQKSTGVDRRGRKWLTERAR